MIEEHSKYLVSVCLLQLNSFFTLVMLKLPLYTNDTSAKLKELLIIDKKQIGTIQQFY